MHQYFNTDREHSFLLITDNYGHFTANSSVLQMHFESVAYSFLFFLTLDGVQVWACEVSGLNLSLKLLCIVLKHHVGWEVKATRCWMEMKGEREGIQTEAGW